MNKERLNRLIDVMSVQTTSYDVKRMNKYIRSYVKQIPDCKIYKDHGNLYVTRGHADIYPCVVAHTDTVHDIHKEFNVLQCGDALLAVDQDYSRVGVGGDDKVGIFVALEILRSTEVCKVAFFRDEEVGCVGSKLADMKFFDDVSFVLQCDRRGYADFVNSIFHTKMFTDEFSQAVAPYLQKYDRTESDGGMTDVWQLTENGLEVAVANMSCGYYDPHSDNEYILISEVFSTADFVKELVDDLGDKRWEVKSEDRDEFYSYSTYGGRHDGYYRGSRYGYRRFGKNNQGSSGWQRSNNDTFSHLEDDDDNLLSGSYEDSWEQDTLVEGATCMQCDNPTELHYDDTIGMFWCHNCQDYIREELVDMTFATSDPNKPRF